MEHLVIGTAGHVDHGKTELVRALTGYDTDRLQEEKARGMTIELGFAPFKLEDKIVSIVDVPGHEKFVKTMVSGASGMDMALLIIAADEGIMPQTIEHIHILSMLAITSVIVVITKTDLICETDLQQLINEIKEYLGDTIYKDAPLCTVSAKLNQGIDELKDCIIKQSKNMNKIRNKELFRMSVDRVFTMKGHGTVVTGTISGGKIEKDDSIEILPSKILSRVRTIQVHGLDRDKAYAGQRCAINLSKVEKSQIIRGDVITKPRTVDPTVLIDTVIRNVIQDSIIKHNQKVKVNIGTQEVMGRLRIIDNETISGKEKGYARIRLEKPIIAIRGDRFIIRSLTPVMTIGGGKVLSHKTFNYPRFSEDTRYYYRLLEKKSFKEIITFLLEKEHVIFNIDVIYRKLYENKQNIWKTLKDLVKEEKVIKLNNNNYLSTKTYEYYKEIVETSFEKYYRDNKYSIYMSKEELRSKYFYKLNVKEFDVLMARFIKLHFIHLMDNKVVINEIKRKSQIGKDNEVIMIEKLIINSGLNGFNTSRLEEVNINKSNIKDIIKFLTQLNSILQIDASLFIHITVYNKMLTVINSLFEKENKITVQEVRDELGIGRKQTIILLEYLDKRGITKRIDNYRISTNS